MRPTGRCASSTTFAETSQLRDGLQEAADLLGCRRCQLVSDSTAVTGLAQSEAQLVSPALLVVNFGAVRCDAVVCTRQYDGGYAAVAARSVHRLGGFVLEARVRQWVRRELQSSSAALLSTLDELRPGTNVRLDTAIREAIGALSTDALADIRIDSKPDPIVIRLDRDEFDVLTRGYADAAVELTRDMLAVADHMKTSSAHTIIILTGAAARNPTIRTRIAQLGFVADFGDPATIIARGATYHGAQTAASAALSRSSAVSVGGPRAAVFPPPQSPADTEPSEQPPAERARVRTLLVNVTRDGRLCRTSLAPHCEHHLEVRIAVARRGEEPPGVDHAAMPDDERAVELLVDVSSDDGTVHGTASVVLPMCDRNRASTVAVVKFATGDDGSALGLNITVLHDGRPIQAARLLAWVRANSSWRDRIRLLQVPLSAAPEPRSDTATADVTVECTATTLKRLGTEERIEIPLSAIEEITSVMAESASKVLSASDAPTRLDEPAAVRLLINLARQGSRLADKLADVGLTDARTIAMKARYDSPVVPLELAYDGVAPDQSARLCACVSDRGARPAAPTSHASQQTVCPYAFWAMNRVIARTVGGRPIKRLPPRPQLAPLSLRPVLYGAADCADEFGPPWETPTKKVEEALTGRAGPHRCTRVRSWRAWRNTVARAAPQLLVVLADTQMRSGTLNLVIGSKSGLALPSVSSRGLGTANAPAPVVLLCACSSNVTGDVLGAVPSALVDRGAAAVVATLTSVGGQHAAAAAAAVVHAMHSNRLSHPTLAAALTQARQRLIAFGSPIGLLLAAHGDIDITLTTQNRQTSRQAR